MSAKRPRRRPSRPLATEATVSTTMRLRRAVRTGLEQAAALEEGLRMRECPGIYFATEPAGRTAKLSGTGLGVWEVLRDFVRDEDVERVRRVFPRLSSAQITAALIYHKRYPDEIRREVDANAALTPEILQQRYPGLVRVVAAG